MQKECTVLLCHSCCNKVKMTISLLCSILNASTEVYTEFITSAWQSYALLLRKVLLLAITITKVWL